MCWARAALENPAITVAITTAVLFLVARIPTQIFYSRLGTTPEDAGLNSVHVLLEGTAAVLLLGLGVAVIYGVVLPGLNVAYWATFRPIAKAISKRLDGDRWTHRALIRTVDFFAGPERTLRQELVEVAKRGPFVVPLLTVFFAAAFLTAEAVEASNEVREGQRPQFELAPWSAWPTEVRWEPDATKIHLPGCESLFYLGEGDGHVVLYDTSAHATYRIDSGLIQTIFPQNCG